MEREPHEESKALTVVGEGKSLPAPVSPVNTDVVAAGAVAVGVIAAGLVAGGIALGRTIARSIAQARREDETRSVVTAYEDSRAGGMIQVTRVSMVVVEEWVSR